LATQDPHALSAEIAFRLLLGLARVDGPQNAAEARLLERCREALGIDAARARELAPLASLAELSEYERPAELEREGEHVLELLMQVAAADGFQPTELAWLEYERAAWGVPRTSFAKLQLRAQQAARTERHEERRTLVLERILAGQRGAWIAVFLLFVGLAALGWRAASQRAVAASWRQVEHDLERSLVFVATRYELERAGERETLLASGSGFFVRPGCVATNKHVVEPWKFAALAPRLAAGWRLVESSVERALWVEGARALGADGELDFALARSSARGELRLLATAPDTLVERNFSVNGAQRRCAVHDDDDNDLALLAVEGALERVPAPLGALNPPRKTDDVLLLGFPRGARMFERGVAECSPAPGVIRKIENTLLVSAPVVEGNSGGPLVDRDGRVIGVATRTAKDSSMGICIAASRVEQLLERTFGGR